MRHLVWMTMFIWLIIVSTAQGAAGIHLSLDGIRLEEAAEVLEVKNDRTLVPIRFVAEHLGAQVEWHPGQKAVLIKNQDKEIVLWINSDTAYVNAEKVTLDSPAILSQDRTLVPVRFVAESLGININWDDKSRTVLISSFTPVVSYSQEDFDWLTKIIEAESGGEPFAGKVAVGAVIINRVKSDAFPNTIKSVIFQKSASGHYQFTPVRTGSINQVLPSQESVLAAQKVLAGEDPTNGALYFYNPDISISNWILSRNVLKRIGNHVFAK